MHCQSGKWFLDHSGKALYKLIFKVILEVTLIWAMKVFTAWHHGIVLPAHCTCVWFIQIILPGFSTFF